MVRTGASITAVANATRNVDADAGSILHVATVIAAPVLRRFLVPPKQCNFKTRKRVHRISTNNVNRDALACASGLY